MRAPRLLLVLPIAGVVACSQPEDDARAAFLHTTLIDDNRPWLEREPELTAQKLRKMASRTFDHFRGTAPQYWRDVTGPGPVDAGTTFGDGPSAAVWVIGDPHPENLGSFRAPDGTVYVDWNDYDGEGWAPWWLDLRRLAVGFVLAGDELMLDEAAAGELARAVARGYADEIGRLAGGAAPAAMDGGPIALDLVEKAREDGDAHETLDDYSDIGPDGRRVMWFGDVTEVRADGVFVDSVAYPSAAEDALARAAVTAWDGTAALPLPVGSTVVKGVSRRLGAGVASYAGYRFYVLLEGPSGGADDDWLLEIKESGDGVRLPAVPRLPEVSARSAGQRVVLAQRRLGLRADGDDLLGWADLSPLSFRVRHRTGYQKGIDLADLGGDAADQLTFAHGAGALLARAHALAPTAGGVRGLDVIAPAIAGRGDALVDETAAFAAAYAVVVEHDAALLAELLERHGPLLGYEPTP